MLSQKLLIELMNRDDLYDLNNIYENKNTGNFVKKEYLELKTGLEEYLKETVNNNLGKNIINLI